MGPLAGLKILEMEGIGPAPFGAMLLADLGASVLRVERPGGAGTGLPRQRHLDIPLRNRKVIAIDLKSPGGAEKVLDLVEKADVLIEGYRPGVMERLGVGPEECLARNERLIFTRVTGWGQEGPLAHAAGHDLNYIALAGVLHGIGRAGQPPTPPLNLIGDYAGGSLYMTLGILSAVYERQRSGKGQVVDAAIVDGAASLMAVFSGMYKQGLMDHQRGANILDSGAYYYDAYECADGAYVTFAPVEHKFRVQMLEKLGIEHDGANDVVDKSNWTAMKERVAARVKEKTQAEWMAIFEGSDACFAPVLSLEDAPEHPHLKQRAAFVDVEGVVQPAPAPRFSRSEPAPIAPPTAASDEDPADVVARWLAG